MGKSKNNTPKTTTPGILDDGFVSKNKKRKEKRHSLNLAVKKMETEEFIPVKRTSLFLAKNAKTPEKSKLLSFGNKQKTPNPSVQATKGILKNTPNAKNATPKKVDTPNSKGTPNKGKNTPKSIMKETLKRKAEQFVVDEASEGEEPICAREVKPYEKGRKKSISFQCEEPEETDESDDEPNAADFIDAEASEGEETDDDEDDDDDDDDDDENDDSEDDDVSLTGEEESGSEEEGDEDEDNEDDEEDQNSSDEEPEIPTKPEKKVVPQEPKKVKNEPVAVTNQKAKIEPAPVSSRALRKKAKKLELQSGTEGTPPLKDYAAFIRNVLKTITKEELKSALASKLDPSKIKNIVLLQRKTVNFFIVYFFERADMEQVLNVEFTIGTCKFVPIAARENSHMSETNYKAFFPRVPTKITDAILMKLVEDAIGSDRVLNVRSLRVVPKYDNRSIIMQLKDINDLKKIIVIGKFEHDGHIIIARQAQESTCQITLHKAVFADLPVGANAETLQQEIEKVIGVNTVDNVRFSFNKPAFSFVTFKDEASKNKALKSADEFSYEGTALRVKDFLPRSPVKRGKSKKGGPVSKRQKTGDGNAVESQGATKKKFSKPNQKSAAENSPKKKTTEPQLNGKPEETNDKLPKNKKKSKPAETTDAKIDDKSNALKKKKKSEA